MPGTRDEIIARMVQHVAALNHDLRDFQELSRGWPKAARAGQYLRMIQRDYQQLEAHVLALAAEIGHMDAVSRHFTGESGTSGTPASRRVGSKSDGIPVPQFESEPEVPKPPTEPDFAPLSKADTTQPDLRPPVGSSDKTELDSRPLVDEIQLPPAPPPPASSGGLPPTPPRKRPLSFEEVPFRVIEDTNTGITMHKRPQESSPQEPALPADSPSSDEKKKLKEMAKDLPKHLLDELRKQGLE